MASSEQTANPVVQKFLKPIKTKLRLKKEAIRQCRLCMRVVPRVDTHDTTAPGSDLRQKILDAVMVEIFPSDKRTSVCINCLMIVDIINDFRMSCRKADTLHATKLMMMHPGSWLSDENKLSLASCHRLVKRNRAEMDALYTCSGVNNEEIHRLTEGQGNMLEPKKEPVLNFERIDVAVTIPPEEENVEIKTEEDVDSGPEMSEQCATEQAAQLEEVQKTGYIKNQKDFMCELCGKFMQKSNMEQHLNMHAGHKPYECPEENCNKSFASSQVLGRHIAHIHIGKQRFECEICHKSIKGGAFFKYHLQTHEANNSLKFPCSVCGKKFYKSYLKDHMFVHTGEMPYKCEFCDRKFAAKNNLVVHRKKHHSVNLDN